MTHGQILFWVVITACSAALLARPFVALRRFWNWKAFLSPLTFLLYPFGFGPYWTEEFGSDPGAASFIGVMLFISLTFAILFGLLFTIAAFHDYCNTVR